VHFTCDALFHKAYRLKINCDFTRSVINSKSYLGNFIYYLSDILVYISISLFGILSTIIHLFRKMYIVWIIELSCCLGIIITRYFFFIKNMGKEIIYLNFTLFVILIATMVYNTYKGRYKDDK